MEEEANNLLDTLIYHERRFVASKENMDRETRNVAYHRNGYEEARKSLLKKGVTLSKSALDA